MINKSHNPVLKQKDSYDDDISEKVHLTEISPKIANEIF